MFNVYHSNKLEELISITLNLMSSCKLRETLQPEIILVQNHNIAQWLQIKLATSLGIAANISFYTLDNFIYKIFSNLLPDTTLEIFFSRPCMMWKIRSILPRFYHQPHFNLIRNYLSNDTDKRKQFYCAELIADLFNQYFLYRPDWLEIWQQGKYIAGLGQDQNWQMLLWQAIIEVNEENIISDNLYQRFIQVLKQSKLHRPSGLPDRLFLYGISSLPPIYLQVLQALSNHINVNFMLMNPYCFHRENIVFQQNCTKSMYRLQNNQKISNSLLESWGKLGKDTMSLLSQLKNIHIVNACIEFPRKEYLLSLVQQDILGNNEICNINTLNNIRTKYFIQPKDYSLSIHVCHSIQREIEILQDTILAIKAQDSSILPCDIIVMVNDIDLYTPAIKAVFGNTTTDRYLPFTIFDRTVKNIHPVLQVFLRILELPFSRLTIEQVLSLLDNSILAKRFSIHQKDLKLLRSWIVESGICWGLDDENQRDFMLPTTGQHTWQFGLKRMLLGYAMNSSNGIWQGILPYNASNGQRAELIGNLAELIMILIRWRNNLKKPRKLKEWLNCARDIIKDFFTSNVEPKVEIALAIILDQWHQILQYGIKVNYDQPISITILREELAMRFQQERMSKFFISGNIHFCNLTPISSIPFKVICLLGMNDGTYPHSILPLSFDLIKQQPRTGDYNKHNEDRYLFLELLLSAQQIMHISFIGYTIQNNKLLNPSVLISELTNYIAQNFSLLGDEQLDEHTCNQNIRKHLWQWHSRMPFSPENFIPGSIKQSFAKEWLLAAQASCRSNTNVTITPHFFKKKSLVNYSPYNTLLLADLQRFYQHPVRTWFQQKLALWFYKESQNISAAEPFTITGIINYQIKKKLLNTLIKGQSLDVLYQQVRAAGLLAYGAFGELYWSKQCSKMIDLANQIRTHLLPEQSREKVLLHINNTVLIGWVPKVQYNGLIRWHPNRLSIKYGLQLWIEHLAYCAIGGTGESRMFGTNSQWHFPVLSSDEARKYLLTLVTGYCQGMSEPLFLLHRSGEAWLTHCFNQKTGMINWETNCQMKAKKYMIDAWEGNNVVPGEHSDLYLQQLIPKLNEYYITAAIQAAEYYFLPPFQHNITDSV